MIITGFIYKPEHKASALMISEGRRGGREKFNKSQRGTKLPRLISQHLFPRRARMRAGTRLLGSLLMTPDLFEGWIDGSLRTFSIVKLSLLISDFSVPCRTASRYGELSGCLFKVLKNPSECLFKCNHIQQKLNNFSK